LATYTSNNYDGRYLQLAISESTNAITNTSTLYWTLTSAGGASSYYSIGATTVTINGTVVYSKGQTSWDSKTFPAAKGSVSGSINVSHDGDGSKSITVVFSTRVYYYDPVNYGGTLTLTKIDRSPPSVSISTNDITASSVYLSVTASTTCDVWDYTTDNWATYKQYSTGGKTSANITVTGLSPNTNYTMAVRARKQSNQVVGYSGTKGVKTLGGSALSAVNNIAADVAVASVTLTAVVYNSNYTHTVKILKGSTTLVTITGVSLLSGTSKTLNMTADQRMALLNAITSVKPLSVTVQLITYSGTSQIGIVSEKGITLTTSESNSAPVFNSFTYKDVNTTSASITGNNQILIQTASNLAVTASAATARNGAVISSYQATIGDKVVSSVTTAIAVGTVNSTGTVPLVVTAIDSRGYSSFVTLNVTVITYEKINISSLVMRRINEVEKNCEVDIYGSFSPVTVGTINKNTFQYLRVRYKKTSETAYSSWQDISGVNSTSSGFSYSINEFSLLEFDPNYSYNVQFYVGDRLGTDTETITIPQGVPLLSLRGKKVGINSHDPQSALDVTGNIRMNGLNVMGVVAKSVPSGTDLNTITDQGIYYISYDCVNYPSTAATDMLGMLEVFAPYYFLVTQRFTSLLNPLVVYTRQVLFDDWSPWVPCYAQITGTFTPKLTFGVDTDSVSPTEWYGTYVKIGKLVTVSFFFYYKPAFPAGGTASDNYVLLDGFPFPGNGNGDTNVPIPYYTGMNNTNSAPLFLNMGKNQTKGHIRYGNSASFSHITRASIAGKTDVRFSASFSYLTDA
jgi:hypothetical protein